LIQNTLTSKYFGRFWWIIGGYLPNLIVSNVTLSAVGAFERPHKKKGINFLNFGKSETKGQK